MFIASKSLQHANMVFVFSTSLRLDNSVLNSLYQNELSVGARFIDDPVLGTKVLELPRLKIQIIVEPQRLRIEDLSQEKPQATNLISHALNIYQQLFSRDQLSGYGFNFDIYYQFDDIIRLNDLLTNFVDAKILKKNNLLNFGVQFTLERKEDKKREQYFVKIITPLKIAVHANHHFPVVGSFLPASGIDQVGLQALFEKCYHETDEVVQSFKF